MARPKTRMVTVTDVVLVRHEILVDATHDADAILMAFSQFKGEIHPQWPPVCGVAYRYLVRWKDRKDEHNSFTHKLQARSETHAWVLVKDRFRHLVDSDLIEIVNI